ncbi:hypothetical protein AVEN_213650-1 [Araneus ventricosus]|uniref:Uncharacterized protein n=1 Tax=Araneus ventricosus TaxID=182803 RepID=A0A4Y2RVJ9_ARAVE|nr:hypothetical protein AVEN_213650-1 [Araneus ventricosus]
MTRTAPELPSPLFKIFELDKRKGALYARMIYRAVGPIHGRVLVESVFEPGTLLPRRRELSNTPPRVFLQLQAPWHPLIILFDPGLQAFSVVRHSFVK